MNGKGYLKALGMYGGAVTLCILILAWIMKLWEADLSVPFYDDQDSILYFVLVKGMMENGWIWENHFLGMPMGLEMYDFPPLHSFHFLILKLISLVVQNYVLSLNLYFLLSFPLTTLTSLFVMRKLGFSLGSALIGSLLYTFLPYHFLRGEGHISLLNYYIVPLVTLVAVQLYIKGPIFSRYLRNNPPEGGRWSKSEILLGLGTCMITASSGLYYAFFSCFVLLVAGVIVTYRRKNYGYLLTAGVFILIISLGVMANLLPSMIYLDQNGQNTEAAKRMAGEAETFGLKIAQIILPVSGHRISYLAELKSRYNKNNIINENTTASLGIIGSIGFLFLLGRFFFKRKQNGLLRALSELTLACLLLGTVGGFGSVFAVIVSPQIRAYNRISIFIAYFAFLAVAFLMDKVANKVGKSGIIRVSYFSVLGLILLIGIYEQTAYKFVPPYDKLKREYYQDAEFINGIEKALPQGAMVFQLPYAVFPEGLQVEKMEPYYLFRGYLHSERLLWSFGAMKGRVGDMWQAYVSAQPVNDLVDTVALAGFDGIYLARFGYQDYGADMEAKLTALTGTKPVISRNNRSAFYDLTDYRNRLRAKYPGKEWVEKQDAALHPVLYAWRGGFSSLEGTAADNWRWSSKEGELHILNNSLKTKQVSLNMAFATGYEEWAELHLSGAQISEVLRINAKAKLYSTTITVPPGKQVIKFSCDARKVYALLDNRDLVFKVENFSLRELN